MKTLQRFALVVILVPVLFAFPASAQTFTECYQDICAMMTISECVAPDTDFDIRVEGYMEGGSSWDVFAHNLMENAEWHYSNDHMVLTDSCTTLGAKGFNWGSSYANTFTLNRPPGTYTFTFVFGSRTFGHPWHDVVVEATVDTASSGTDVAFDVKPQSCPNPLNVGRKGVLSAAIAGSADFDVTEIDPSTIRVAGVEPVHYAYEDVTTPYEPLTGKLSQLDCTDAGPDGYLDLTLKFRTEAIAEGLETLAGRPLEDGQEVVVDVAAELIGGGGDRCQSAVAGEDVIRVIVKK